MRKPIRHQIVEHMSRLGDAAIHQVGDAGESYAQTYHYHNTLEVIIIKKGWIEGLVSGAFGTMPSGTVIVIGNDVPHCVLRASADCKAMLVHIPAELLKWDEMRFPELTHGVEYLRNCRGGVLYSDSGFAARLSKLAGRIALAEGFMRMSLLMQMLHILSQTPPKATLKAQQANINDEKGLPTAIDRAFSYIYSHFRDKISLSDVAEYAGLNPSALCRSFKKASGSTVWQFCTRLKIEYACNQLLTTNLDISEIAYQSGYDSYPFFSRQFKKLMKMSPSEYRGITSR